jgi:hypothetical protein
MLRPARGAFLLLALAAPTIAQAQQPAPDPTSGRLRNVLVTTGDVFADEVAEQRPLARLVNAVHWVTKPEVIEREVWIARGERIDATRAAELERNLRALGLFADVSVRLVATGEPDEVDLRIVTRDRLSLTFGAGGSYVGGVSGYRASVGDSNILGLGDRLAGSFSENSEGEFRGNVAYTDLHVLDTWHTAAVRLSRTDEGDSAGFELRRPFKHLADPRSWSATISHDESEADYYLDSDVVAEVPLRTTLATGNLLWGDGPADARTARGFVVALDERHYGTATGIAAPGIRVPGDTTNLFAGATAQWHWIDGYRKVEGLDTLQYVQDLTLGRRLDLQLGARGRNEEGAGSAVQPEFAASASWAAEPLSRVFTNVGAAGAVRWESGDAVGWHAGAAGRAFWLMTQSHTLGASAAWDGAGETQDLPVQLTLGEDNGLRGYPARQFAGDRRLRTNVEARYDTGIEFATLRLGLVAFFDAGWVGSGSDLGRPYRSAGLGLRIGSKPLLGGGLLRIDFARPFDDAVGTDEDWTVSVTVGQVFTFGGVASELSAR